MKRPVIIWSILALVAPMAAAQDLSLPESPLDGRILFETRGCINCHALDGFGGDLGPDLATDLYFGSFLGFVAAIWNHIPDMNRQYRLRHTPRPEFTEPDMLDLAGFMYYLRYLGEPGSVSRGRDLLGEKQCVRCHGHGSVPAFEKMSEDLSPQAMVQAMWNHGPEMQDSIDQLRIGFPTLDGRDVGDISAYLSMVASHPRGGGVAPGNPARGRILFRDKQCVRCHPASDDAGTAPGPALDEMDLRRNVLGIAAAMWNHGPEMRAYMRRAGMDWPRFEGGEMADVIAYLYWLGFQDPPGSLDAGRRVFEEKGCAACHGSDGDQVGPDLDAVRNLQRPGRMAQLLWNHADEMEDLMLARNRPWPTLTEQDLRDLLAFLRSRRAP